MSDDTDNQVEAHGMLESIKRLARTAAATFQNRIELFVLELQEEGARFIGVLLLAGIVLLFCGLALIMGMFSVLLFIDEQHRPWAALIMAIIMLVGAGIAAVRLCSRLQNWSAFSDTRTELQKDREWLQSKHPKA
jgi:uncharacterized membrane protein YqjE